MPKLVGSVFILFFDTVRVGGEGLEMSELLITVLLEMGNQGGRRDSVVPRARVLRLCAA